MTPILLLETNEIPWRLIDRYSHASGLHNLHEFFAHAHQYTTVAVDTGELSPWVTWPTLHRGIDGEKHGIRNLGQDPRTFRGTPIWKDVRDRGGSIGIFGSLQSWPPIDPGEGGFYVPDTFAPDERCIPESLNRLQAFNLSQVRRNARVVDGSMPRIGDAVRYAVDCTASGVRMRTLARLGAQLLAERFDSTRRARRPVYQTVLLWDAFRHRFDPERPPALSTFFTNHVAGVMHRYWRDVFPEDFTGDTDEGGASREPLMRFALEVLDEMLGDVLRWSRRNPDLVTVVAASMGQGAIHRRYHEGFELVVEDLTSLMAAAGLERHEFEPLMAMVPQVAVRVAETARREAAKARLESAAFAEGAHFIRVAQIGDTLSITVHTPPLDKMQGAVSIGGRSASLREIGIRKQEVEPGTGYHVPEGILALYSPRARQQAAPARSKVYADKVKGWLLGVSETGMAGMCEPDLAGEGRA